MPLNIVAFTGSLRKASVNKGVLRFLASVAPKYDVTLNIISADLPLYNADLEADVPAPVLAFREAVQAADAVLLSVEEFNYSFSGAMKSALDWASRPLAGGSNVFQDKIVGMVGAGGYKGTARAQIALRSVLLELGSIIAGKPEVTIQRWNADWSEKFDAEGNLTDDHSKESLDKYLEAYTRFVRIIIAGRAAVSGGAGK